jgi:uncharacterized protein
MMNKLCVLHKVAFALVIVGGLNWLLVAFGYNLVEMLLGSFPMVVKVVYVLVGASALSLLMAGKCCANGCEHAATPAAPKA